MKVNVFAATVFAHGCEFERRRRIAKAVFHLWRKARAVSFQVHFLEPKEMFLNAKRVEVRSGLPSKSERVNAPSSLAESAYD